jgi:uncharacterized protein YjbI with pentapeptide repeats
MNDSNFFSLDLRGIEIVSCEVHNVDFEKTNLSKAVLNSSDFSNSSFNKTNLTYADFTDATNYRVDPNNSNIKGAKFSLPEVLSLLDQWGITIL